MESIGGIRIQEGMTDQSEPTDTKAQDQALTEGIEGKKKEKKRIVGPNGDEIEIRLYSPL